MKLITFTNEFYTKYKHCSEMLQKKERPYMCLEIRIDDKKFAIPLRHHIKHPFVYHTIGDAGLDFTKAVLIVDERYISSIRPTIEAKEFLILRKNEKRIVFEFSRYLNKCRHALKHKESVHSQKYWKYGALQYFEEYL